MKKVIILAAVLLVAIVGLTSYNGKEEPKRNGDDKLLAQLRTMKEGDPVIVINPTTPPPTGNPGGLRKD